MSWNPSPSRRVLFPIVLALLAFSPSGCKKAEAPAEGGEEEHAAPVKWETAEKADLEEWTDLLGTTQPLPNHVASISTAVAGYVQSVLPATGGKEVVEGQRVEAGQVLVRLDDRILKASRDKLVAGEAELKEQIQQAANAVELARLDLDRLERLQAPNGSNSLPLVTRIELDKARLALKDAESKLKGAQAKEVVSHADVKMIDEELDQYTLRTPIAGQLGMVHARPGQSLSAGTTVAEVVNLDEIDVLCFVPARTVARLTLGQSVRIDDPTEPPSDASKVEVGHIVFISEQAQAETGTVAVKAGFPNRTRKLRANTLVRIRVLTAKKPDCLTLPDEAVLEDQEEPAVLVVETEKKKTSKGEIEEEHKVHRYQAKLGLRDREKHRIEILGMLEVKEKDKKDVPLSNETLFIVEGGHGLEDGDLVKEEEHKEEPKEGDTKVEHKGSDKKDEQKESDKKEEPKGGDKKEELKGGEKTEGSKEGAKKDGPKVVRKKYEQR